MGGAHGALALARSAGALGFPVTLATRDNPLASWSRHVKQHVSLPDGEAAEKIEFLIRLAEQGLEGAILVPAGDAEVGLVSQNREALAAYFDIPLPSWDRLKWVCEKPLLYGRAEKLGIAHPRTYRFASMEDATRESVEFPVVLKPNMGGGKNRITLAKALRVDSRDRFLAELQDAANQIGIENVVVQELIPGGGESQYSYAALWRDGKPVLEMTARRSRQYPVDFGYTSTFVEVVDDPGIIEPSRTLLRSIQYEGLVEVEYKFDRRENTYKVLDVNPRPWSWLALGAGAGTDLGGLLLSGSSPPAKAQAEAGAAWLYLPRDALAIVQLIASGRIGIRDYLASFQKVRACASYTPSDPIPGLIDLPLSAWRVLTRRVLRRL